MSTAHHPETDGQSEAIIKQVKIKLGILDNGLKSNWVEAINEVEFVINSLPTTVNKLSPFEIVLGYKPMKTNIRADVFNWLGRLVGKTENWLKLQQEGALTLEES